MGSVTIKDVAREAGVGLGTASRALSGSGSVSETTRRRVLASAQRLDYHPNAQARSLRSTRTYTIGLLIPDVRNPFFSELAHAFQQESLLRGYTTLFGDANEDVQQQERFLTSLRSHRTDALALAPLGGSDRAITALLDDGMPAVFVDRTVPDIDIPAVTSDPVRGIEEAVEHLLGLGHTRLGYIAGPPSVSSAQERLQAWEQALAAHGRAVDPDLVFWGDFQQESGSKGAAQLIEHGATALFAADSPMALGAFDTCADLGLRIGKDIDLIGFDDLRIFRHLQPPLTVVAQNVAAMGQSAAQMLVEVIEGGDPAPIRLSTRLLVRSSTHRIRDTPRSCPIDVDNSEGVRDV